MTIVIRDPKARFISGMYEIIAKQIYGVNVELLAEAGVDPDAVRRHIDLFYNTRYWHIALAQVLRLKPNNWESDKEISAVRWQYHVGNWLADVYKVVDIAADVGVPVEIVDISNLTPYLKNKGIEHLHLNKRENNMCKLADLSADYASIYNDIDHKAIQDAFAAAFENTAVEWNLPTKKYLESECKIYADLKSKSIRF